MDTPDATLQLHDWLANFQTSLAGGDVAAVTRLFANSECLWRDMVAFTWNIATMDGKDAIMAMVDAQLRHVQPVQIVPEGDAKVEGGRIEGWFNFETVVARGKGHVRLRDGKCWTLLTSMTELKGFEEPSGFRRPAGIVHKARKGGWPTWAEERAREERSLGTEEQPYCLIVGGGQAGLMLGARLKRLGVPTLIIDTLPKPGDSWRCRYRSLYLHDAVWMDHFPYLPFPDHWPIYMSKDKIGDWLEIYCKTMELNFWGSTSCLGARYDADEKRWSVTVDHDGRPMVLRPHHFVISTGLSGMPQRPSFPGMEAFEGAQYHSSEHRDGTALAGKKCVIVGANNSAHDIAVDLWSCDADVVMIQRSPTTVLKATAMRRGRDKGPLSEAAAQAGLSIERADLMIASMPFRLKEAVDRADCERIMAEDREFYDRLRASGFLFDFGEDNTAIGGKYMRRASGYYIDVGASDLVADGEVKVRSGVGVAEIRRHSIVLSDGSELAADAIIYATGFGPMESWIEMLISKDVADKVGRVWGLGSDTALDPGPWEGELRNMWKPLAQEALWLNGGNLAQLRYHSLHLALQIKAHQEGLPMPVHRTTPFVRPKLVP